MTCFNCGLPDPYRGQGDGIGSCECPRCDCCGAGPDDCDCSRDFEPGMDDENEPYDPWCNDTGCGRRNLRLLKRAAEAAEGGEADLTTAQP